MSHDTRAAALSVALIVLCLVAITWIRAMDYGTARSAAVSTCEAIDRSEYQSGLYFNPEGYRSFYVRSACFQKAAVQFRDESLCTHVRQRRSLFASSWGYSASQCRKLVAEGVAKDRSELEEIKRLYSQSPVQLEAFRIERNGNGRDFDILPMFSGSYAHGYALTFEILDESSTGAPIPVHASGYYLDSRSDLRIYVTQAEIRQRFPGFALNRPYRVRATAVLDVGNGGQAGYWSEAFIERVFPIRERLRSITIQSVF
ncbi:MAG TPA: hypothetical protein VJM31_11940 [Vicinamibacterales bacterium]|nr:hypothetical protein [Vicinamibacterales bacterium]